MDAWLFVGSEQQSVGTSGNRHGAASGGGAFFLQAWGASLSLHVSGMSAQDERSSSGSSGQDRVRPTCVMSFAIANACSGPQGSSQSPTGRVGVVTCQFRHSALQERDRGKDGVVIREACGWQS